MPDSLSVLLIKAAQKRLKLNNLITVRLFDGEGDGHSGLWIDRYGPLALAHLLENHQSFKQMGVLRRVAAEFCAVAGVEHLYLRQHFSTAKKTTERGAELLFGNPLEELWIRENNIEYSIRPTANTNAGLFMDMREVRARLKAECSGARVLNTFCFTGSLGVAAFCGGATEVVQVDISTRMLKWGRENWQRNLAQGTGEMRFIQEDCRAFLRREVRRVEVGKKPYDWVLIDPPSFGSGDGNAFILEKHLDEMLIDAMKLLADGGRCLLTCNFSGLTLDDLKQRLLLASRFAKRTISDWQLLLPPVLDFTSPSETSPTMRGWVVVVSGKID
jgi:23S rRNA (cytosine1962-C5)-methyltransferase